MRRKIKESFCNGKSKKQTATVRELKIKEVEQTNHLAKNTLQKLYYDSVNILVCCLWVGLCKMLGHCRCEIAIILLLSNVYLTF